MTDKSVKDEVRGRALGAMLTDAFFTWPSAVTIALTILAFFSGIRLFDGWQPWMWLAAGGVLEAIYLAATLADPTAQRQAVARILTERYDPRDIRNTHARQQLQKALEYKKNIDQFVTTTTGALRVQLDDTSGEIEDWLGLIYKLARSIDTFESNAIIRRDRQQVPTEIQSIERRIAVETDPGVRAELQNALDIRRGLWEDLQQVASLVKRTEIKMEATVAQLSTVYTKLQLIDVKNLDSSRAKRIQAEIHDEVASLNDIVLAMDDVQTYGNYADALATLSAEQSASAGAPGIDLADSDPRQAASGRDR
jgi:hypothetical protein